MGIPPTLFVPFLLQWRDKKPKFTRLVEQLAREKGWKSLEERATATSAAALAGRDDELRFLLPLVAG